MDYLKVQNLLKTSPKRWLVTGVAGFIGSNLLEHLLKLNQFVAGLDNFITGKEENIREVLASASEDQRKRFTFVEGDIRDLRNCIEACGSIDYVLHQAALGSVPRSIDDPVTTNEINVSGTLNMLVAARTCGVKRFIYASSSSVYGDYADLPKIEERIGSPLSPYAVTKLVNEQYAKVFADSYGMETMGLRYFNVFGPRQDPNGPYAAVIPRWIAAMKTGRQAYINGTGETSRDFCYVANVVQINLLAATTENPVAVNQVYNVALNQRTTLSTLFTLLHKSLLAHYPHLENYRAEYRDFRAGDIMHSQADISKASKLLHYEPTHDLGTGLQDALAWYRANLV